MTGVHNPHLKGDASWFGTNFPLSDGPPLGFSINKHAEVFTVWGFLLNLKGKYVNF